MSEDNKYKPGREFEAHAQPFVRIQSVTIQENPQPPPPMQPPPITLLRPFPPALPVPIPAGGTTTLTVRAYFRKDATMKLLAILTDQDSAAMDDHGPIGGAACGPDWCFDFTLTTRGKHYDLDVQLVETADPTNVHIDAPGPQIDT